jgi:hypothetical protein
MDGPLCSYNVVIIVQNVVLFFARMIQFALEKMQPTLGGGGIKMKNFLGNRAHNARARPELENKLRFFSCFGRVFLQI